MKMVTAKHIKDLRFEMVLDGNKENFYCDKPEDESAARDPDPMDLFLASLGSCVGMFASMYCRNHKKIFSDLRVDTSGELSSEGPQRLINIRIRVFLDADLSDDREQFLRFVRACIVHNTVAATSSVDIDLA